jgi:hypothetical protein
VKESKFKEVLRRAVCVSQVVECLLCKAEALNSKPSTAQKTNLKIKAKNFKKESFLFLLYVTKSSTRVIKKKRYPIPLSHFYQYEQFNH